MHLLGASLYIYMLYFAACWMCKQAQMSRWIEKIEHIEENSILYLLLSNLFIFTLTKTAFYRCTPLYCVILAMILIIMIYYCIKITRKHGNIN